MWRPEDIRFVLLDDATDDPVVTLQISTPAGRLLVMGEPVEVGDVMLVRGVHMHGEGVGPNGVGAANLAVLAQVMMERMDLRAIVVEGAVRTTGARPGHRPRPLRFRRRVRPEPN